MRLKHLLLVKSAIVAVAVVMLSIPATAQTYNNWYRPSGQNNIYNVNTGNIGIGTTAPGALFQMISEGSAGSPGTYPSSNRLEVCSWAGDGPAVDNGVALLAVNAGRINTIDANAANAYLVRVCGDDRTVFAIKGNGRIGIGTTTPGALLQLGGGGGTNAVAGSQIWANADNTLQGTLNF